VFSGTLNPTHLLTYPSIPLLPSVPPSLAIHHHCCL